MFDDDETVIRQQTNGIIAKNDELPPEKQENKPSKAKKIHKDEDTTEDDEPQDIPYHIPTLPQYIKYGDVDFSDKIFQLFTQKRLPRFCIVNGKAGIGKAYGVNIAISKIFEQTGFVVDMTIEQNQPQNPDVLYIKNLSKKDDEDLKSMSKNLINLKDDIEGKLKIFIQKTPLMDGQKFVIIDNIDGLSRSVANSMLKILEEADGTLFVIAICHDITRVMKTILSRGVVFNVKPPKLSEFEKILSIQNIATSKVDELYALSSFSPFMAKLLIKANYNNTLEQINHAINNKTPIKIEQVGDIIMFCILASFVIKNSVLDLKINPNAAKNTVDAITSSITTHITYGTTADLAKINILKSVNGLITNIGG